VGISPHPTKGKKMTAKAKAPKNAVKNAPKKAVKIEAEVNDKIVDLYSVLVNHEAEIGFILEVAEMLATGETSVRQIQASIEVASSLGSAPTIKKAHAQYIQTASRIIETQEGADKVAVANILKLATRVQRSAGVEKVEAELAKSTTYADLNEKTPTINTNKKASASEPVAKKAVTAGEIIAEAIAKLSKIKKAQLKTDKVEDLIALNTLLKEMAKNSATPKAKVSA